MSLLDEVALKQAGIKTSVDYLNIEKAPTPITPAKKVSILEEIRNTPVSSRGPGYVNLAPKQGTGTKVPAHLQGLRADEYEQSVVKSVLNQPSLSIGPVAPAYIPYKKNPTEEDEIEEFVTLQKKFNERFSTEKGDKLNKETNIGVLLDTIKGQYSFTDDEALAVILKTVPLGQLPESLNIDERVKNQYLSQYLPKNWEKVDKDYNSRGEVYKKYQTSLKAYDSALFTDKELDEIKKNDNSFSQFKKDLLLNLGQGIATDFAGGLASVGGYLGNKVGIDTPYLDKVSSEAQLVGEMAQEKKSALQQYKEMKPFEWDDLGDSSTYIKISRALPNLVAFAGVAGLVGKGAMVSARLLGLGKTAQVATAVVTSGFVNRGFESLQEAGGVFQELRVELGDEKADDAADEVFTKNMALVGNDIIQFGTNFFPGKTALTKVLGVAFDMGTEGGEEFLQGYIQYAATEKAYGRTPMSMGDWSKTSAAKEAVAGGLVLGGISQGAILGAGGTQNYFKNKKFTAALGKISLHAGASGIEGFDAEIDALLKKGTINQGQADGMKEIYNQALKANFDAIRENKQETVSESIDKAIPSTIVENAPAVNPNTKPKNIARIENEYRNASPETRTNIVVRALKSFGYKVKTSKSSISDSEYLTVSHKGVEGGVETTIRLSDHKLPQKYSSKQKKKDFEIDKNSADPFPFNDVIAKMSGENVKQGNFEKYKASADVQKFERAMKNMENEEIADYMSGSDQAVYDAGGLELTSRGVSADELTNYLKNATPKKYERPRKSIMDEVREGATIDMTGATDENLRAKSFGFTYDPQGGALYEAGGKTDGIVVTPFPNRSGFIPGTMDEISFGVEFEIYVQKNMDLIQQGLKAGGWYSDKRQGLVFDVGIVLPTEFRAFAEKLGKDTNQEGIFNLFDTNEDTAYIPTGGDGTVPQGFDEKAILDIIRPYISKQPSYDTISPTNGISGPIENEQGTNSGNLTTDVSTDNVGSTTAEVNTFYNPELFKLQDVYVENFTKRLAQIPEAAGTELPTIAKKIENIGDMLREAYQNKQISTEYIQEKYDAVTQEIAQQPELFKDLPKEAKTYMKQIADKYETLGDLGKDVAGIVNAMWQNSPTVKNKLDAFYDKLSGTALPATLFDHPTEEIIPLPDPFADQPYDITKYNYNTSKIEKKSGYRFTGKNLAITAGIVGGLAAATAAPIIGAGFAVTTALGLSPGGLIAVGGILFPNTFSSIFYKSKILNAFRDENGVPVSQLMTNEDAYNLSRVQAVVKQYGMDTALENLANDKEYIDKLYDILWDGIDDILAKETHNLENGHRLSAQDKQAIKHIFPASLGNFRFNALHLNYDALLALKKMMAMKNLYDYYPQDIAKIIRENTPEIIDLFEKSDIKGNTDRGYRELGQNQVDAGLLPEYNVVEGYERFLVLSETYKYDMNKGEDISHGYANMEEYLAAKELEYSLADKETQNAMESELSRLRTSIQKAKGDDSVDVFRVHYDLAQFLDYIIQYSETITRKQKMDILTKVNELDPISIGTKKLHADKIFVSLIDDLFFPNKLTLPSLIEMKRANKLYGPENNAAKSIVARNLSNNMIAGLAVDIVSGSFKGAYWLIGGGAQLLQGIYSIAFVNMPGLLKSGYRFATVGGFYNTKNVGKFFIENRLSARHTTGNMILQHVADEIRMRNEYSRFGINAIYRTAGNIGTALDSSSQFLFGGPVETWVSEHIILNEIYAYMDKKGGQYSIVQKGKQAGVNAQKLIEDFNNLPEGEKGILLARLREISQSLYDGITRSASGIAILRIPYMKFFNRFISSFSVQQINKLADVKSLINDTISSKSFKDAYHTFNSDKNQFYRTAGKNILGYALTAGLILNIMIEKNTEDCKDDECRKAKTLESTTMFTRALGVKLENAVLSSLRSIIGTPAGYYDKLMFSVDDIVQGVWTGNDSQRDVGINGLVSNLGGIKNVVTMPIFGGMFMGTTAWLNATNLTNTNWGDWFAHNFTRLYATDREKMNIIDQVAKNPNADMDGFWWLNNQATIISNQEYTNTQHGFARIMMGISEKGAELFFGLPFINLLGVGGEGTVTDTKDLMDQRNAKLEAFENVKTIETTIENTDKTNLNDIIYDAALALGVDKNPQDIHFVSQLSKSFGGLRKNNVDLLRAMDNNSQTGGIVVTNSDVSDGKTFLAKLRANPMLYAQFVKGVKAIASNPKDYDSEDKLKKLFSGGIKSTDPLLDALSFYNKSPVYSNNGADFLLKSVGKDGITGTPEEVTQKLSTIEAYLRVSSVSDLTSDASLRGIQIAFGDKYETSIIDLKKRGLFSAHDYPNIAESMIALVGARSLSKFDAKDMQPQIDMIKAGGAESINEVVKPTEEYAHGVIMSTEGSAWNHGVAIVNEKESPLYAPISGVVLESSYIQGLGNQIKIQDINGNVIQYSNLSGYNVAPGQFIKAGMQVGKGEVIQSTLYSPENVIASPDKTEEYIKTDITPVKKATPTISAPPAAERNTMPVVPNEGLRHSSADQDWSLGDTPLNEIVKRELDAIMKSENVKKIDFSKLSAKINGKGTKKKKTSPKKSLSILEEVISLQPKKSNLSIMQEIISKQTTK